MLEPLPGLIEHQWGWIEARHIASLLPEKAQMIAVAASDIEEPFTGRGTVGSRIRLFILPSR